MTSDLTLSTTQYAPEVEGFGGPVPLEIHISQSGTIDSITAPLNNEDAQYWAKAKTLLHAWDGLTVDEALAKQVDAVSGATFSSRAITEGVRTTLTAYREEQAKNEPSPFILGLGGVMVAIVFFIIYRRHVIKKYLKRT